MATALPPAITVPSFTVELLDSLPDDGCRYELLEGMLLVTPAPATPHQVVASRLMLTLGRAIQDGGFGYVVSPGVVPFKDKTQLEPDVLVYPAAYPPSTKWKDIRGWWLAVEVFSPSSKAYDALLKRKAYLDLGVQHVWLVDTNAREIAWWARGVRDPILFRHPDVLRWQPGALPSAVAIDLAELFRDVPYTSSWDDE